MRTPVISSWMRSLNVILFLALEVALAGCVETIVMDSGEDLPVMVNCILNSSEKMGPQTLWLQYVKEKSASEFIPITEAEVYVETFLDRGRHYKNVFKHVDGGKWETDSLTVIFPGAVYNLTVRIPGRDVITGQTAIPGRYSISSSVNMTEGTIEWCLDESSEPSTPVWLFASKGKHRADEPADSRYPLLVTDNPNADDFNANGQKFSDLPIEGKSDGESLAVTWPAFKRMKKLFPDLPLHDGFIRLSQMDDKKFHLLAGPLKYKESYQDHFDFYFVPEDLDRYLRDVYVNDNSLDHDLTKIYSIENALSNIEGGVGIFSGVFRDSRIFLDNY